MKMHIRNLLLVILLHVTALILIFGISFGTGIVYLDGINNDDELIFYLSILTTALVCFFSYLVFYLIKRKNADKKERTDVMGLGVRILGGIITSILAAAVLIGMSFIVSPYGNYISLLHTYIEESIIFLGIFVAANFINFIIFKPHM